MSNENELSIEVGHADAGRARERVSALLRRPEDSRALLVFAHGAGAGMRHPFMDAVAAELAERGIATLRYQFPYMEKGSRRPDRAPLARATVRAAVAMAAAECPDLPLFAGGKSFGGRMTSQAAADAEGGGLPGVRGLVFLGFPLHPPGKRATDRADHLADVPIPMLFLQGTRDNLAELDLLRPVLSSLNDAAPPDRDGPHATLHVVEGGDHSFKVLKRSGRTEGEVMAELGSTISDWMEAALDR